jgi:hypothetical protein
LEKNRRLLAKEVDMTAITKKVKTVVSVFDLPQRLGVLQYVEYEPPPREWCTEDGCPYEGVLTAEGCKKDVCVRYRVWVHSKDGRRWDVKERWTRRRDEDVGGCINYPRYSLGYPPRTCLTICR